MSAVVIPAGELVSLVKYPCKGDDRMAEVLWGKRPIVVIGRGLELRASQIEATSPACATGKNQPEEIKVRMEKVFQGVEHALRSRY